MDGSPFHVDSSLIDNRSTVAAGTGADVVGEDEQAVLLERMARNRAAAQAKLAARKQEQREALRKQFVQSIGDPGWTQQLEPLTTQPFFSTLLDFLIQEQKAGAVYPPQELVFSAFNACPFDAVKVVILGQDPYYSPGQAHGMSFSVSPGVQIPGSLANIYKELSSDIGFQIPAHGYLMDWAKQGVLLLNATLTVRGGQPNSHSGKGWEQLTDHAITALSEQKAGLVFMLWGNDAKSKESLIDKNRHLILTATHPSPRSADRGFFGCKHFSQATTYLREQCLGEVSWALPSTVTSTNRGQKRSAPSTTTKSPDACFLCGETGHWASACPSRDNSALKRARTDMTSTSSSTTGTTTTTTASPRRTSTIPHSNTYNNSDTNSANISSNTMPARDRSQDTCYKCNGVGHWASACPQQAASDDGSTRRYNNNSSNSGVGRTCFNCGQTGHFAPSCPEPRKESDSTRTYNSGGGGGSSGATCFNCGQIGHYASSCSEPRKSTGGGGSSVCYNCSQPGHFSGACPEPRKESSGRSYEGGAGGRTCYNCGEAGHFAPQCPEPRKQRGGRGGY
eukprot:TRINITY_DN4724_c0_g1_i3.p1 TRINITY_DN4724_c0_g1~~TRINITY_DN4724_c0_g1_i3.p1  ORF type:complete len:565 (+),score=58.64 TRINITY_DN4724_c0_g1_i3:22-1716(+)